MATTKATHTPGPLTVEKLYLIADGKGIVADLDASQFDDNESKANAARLALCWNTHDELVAALRGALPYLAARATDAEGYGLVRAARAALAKAEGGTS